MTNAPGLNVYDLDGTLREPPFHGTIVMPGSTLYRWSDHAFPPTFHDVEVRGDMQKTSVVGFFNFPDHAEIPRPPEIGGEPFIHDIRAAKEDDRNPNGKLKPLWDKILAAHNIRLDATDS